MQAIVICDSGRTPLGRAVPVQRILKTALKRAFDEEQRIAPGDLFRGDLARVARRHDVPLLVPPGRELNAPAFVGRLRALESDFALSLVCSQILRPELLSVFPLAVNYHDGLLPSYRGLFATEWSLYHGERVSGLTFHRITAGIDEGPVLLQDTVRVAPGTTSAELVWSKTLLAATLLDAVLDAVARGDPGIPQRGPASYFGAKELREIRSIDDPGAVSWEDLRRRLRAFGRVEIRIGNRLHPVTKLRRLDGRRPRRPSLVFTTADGMEVEPTRFRYAPFRLYAGWAQLVGRPR